jgi:hypothetical protein
MQFTDPKPKRTRTGAKEASANPSQPAAAGSEEAVKPRRKSSNTNGTMDPTPAAKQHRVVTKKASEPVSTQGPGTQGAATQGSVQSSGVHPVGAPSQELPARISRAVTHEDIAALAHSYWLERGGQHGSDEDDWLRAEHALRG